ncbi:hypothetical protein ACFFZ0_003727 [Pseudomonas aeruginosa]|nr:hypothetical protein [Pseudomonas aeruginosa]
MSNCSHEAWDFGALQCPDCGAVKGHVADADYAKLEAEAKRDERSMNSLIVVALREYLHGQRRKHALLDALTAAAGDR